MLAGGVVFILPVLASAELSIEIIPTYPEPGETVYISVNWYGGDLDAASIVWYQDDQEVLSGIGQTRYSFRTGEAGQETKITIQVTPLNGSAFSQSFTLGPASVDIVWEADTYVPPFYKGKALHAGQGKIRFAAIPNFVKNGQTISPANLIYEWSTDTEVYQSRSGYGRAFIDLNGSILGRAEHLRLTVRDPLTNMVAEKSIYVSPVEPEIIFYQNDPYYGLIFNSAISRSFDLNADEVQVLAVPFYFSRSDLNNLEYRWRLNSAAINGLTRTAIFRKPEGTSGRSSITLDVRNLARVLQFADEEFSINFTE